MALTTLNGVKGSRAIYLGEGAELTLETVHVHDFDVSDRLNGALIYGVGSNVVTIRDSFLHKGRAKLGGAIELLNGELYLTDTDVYDNSSEDDCGGICLLNCTGTITNGRMYNNVAKNFGGGLGIVTSSMTLSGMDEIFLCSTKV